MLHALYDPRRPDVLVREQDLNPDAKTNNVVTIDKQGPTPADFPAGAPQGCHWMQVTDDIDGTGPAGSHLGPGNKLGTPTIVLRGMHAVRHFPLVAKKK
jgi:hypothetical protein